MFAEELTRYLAESGGLVRTGEGLSLRADAARLSLPGSLQDLVMARVDRLPETARAVLQVASVIGRRFSREVLQTAAGVNGHLPDCLRELEAQELIFRERGPEDEQYVFKHALIQEAVYGSLLTTRRADLHAHVAEAIERSYGDRLAEWAEVLANHWGQTPRVDRTIQYLRLAGEKSLRVYAVEAAHRHFQGAAQLLEANPGCADDRFLADMVLAWARAYYYRKDFHGLIGLTRYLPRVEALGDQRRQSLLLFWLGFAHVTAAHYEAADSVCKKALALGEALGDEECIGYPCMGLAFLYEMKPFGEPRDVVVRFARRGLEIAERLNDVYLISARPSHDPPSAPRRSTLMPLERVRGPPFHILSLADGRRGMSALRIEEADGGQLCTQEWCIHRFSPARSMKQSVSIEIPWCQRPRSRRDSEVVIS